jgi:antitoxin (DNA-binding transcriptional repressor) of toxin-antitoxin stability system
MRNAQVSELKERLDEVIEAMNHGETVEIQDGEKTVADLIPRPQQTAHEPFLDDFFTRPLPKAAASVLDQLIEDRRTGR